MSPPAPTLFFSLFSHLSPVLPSPSLSRCLPSDDHLRPAILGGAARRGGGQGLEGGWKGFEEAFRDHYPGAAKRREFVSLVQGRRSVVQYETRFSELARFASDLVTSEEERSRRFVDGLRPAVRSRLGVLPMEDYSVVYERARLAEREWDDSSRIRGRVRSEFRDREPRSQMGGPSTQSLSAPVVASRRPSSRPAQSRRCYGCRRRGHVLACCPLSGGSIQLPQCSPQRQLQFQASEVPGTLARQDASGSSGSVRDQSQDEERAPVP